MDRYDECMSVPVWLPYVVALFQVIPCLVRFEFYFDVVTVASLWNSDRSRWLTCKFYWMVSSVCFRGVSTPSHDPLPDGSCTISTNSRFISHDSSFLQKHWYSMKQLDLALPRTRREPHPYIVWPVFSKALGLHPKYKPLPSLSMELTLVFLSYVA